MRNRKRHKTIDDVSVSQLLDDFLSVDIIDSGKPPKKIDDEEYIRMMLKKDAQMKLERQKRKMQSQAQRKTATSKKHTIDEDIRQRFFPDVDEEPVTVTAPPVEKVQSPEEQAPPDNGIVAEILDSLVVKDVSGLAAQMKDAVDFVQEEMGTSEHERRLIEALEECMRPAGCEEKRLDSSSFNDNILLLKRCQNCYFCIGEKNTNGSLWCLCANQDRSTEVEVEDSWVKSKLNLSCWKAPQN